MSPERFWRQKGTFVRLMDAATMRPLNIPAINLPARAPRHEAPNAEAESHADQHDSRVVVETGRRRKFEVQESALLLLMSSSPLVTRRNGGLGPPLMETAFAVHQFRPWIRKFLCHRKTKNWWFHLRDMNPETKERIDAFLEAFPNPENWQDLE